MNKAIFIDRDGVINDDTGHYYVFRREHFRLNEGITEALKEFINKGYLVIVISNQGGIARGQYTKEDVDRLHRHFLGDMRKHGIEITEIYYCPHHDTIEKCLCRKPLPIMLQKALARFRIDPENSYFIGDKESDMEAGRKAGVHTILVEPNSDLKAIAWRIS